jgi:hypothetical protein
MSSYAPYTGPVNPVHRVKLIRPPKPAHGKYSLTLSIRGTKYRVLPVACQCEASKCYELRKADGTAYHVSRHEHGISCTCPDQTWKREGLTDLPCKHGAALLALGMLDAPAYGAPARPVREHGHGQPPSARYTEHDHGPGRDTWRSGGHDA